MATMTDHVNLSSSFSFHHNHDHGLNIRIRSYKQVQYSLVMVCRHVKIKTFQTLSPIPVVNKLKKPRRRAPIHVNRKVSGTLHRHTEISSARCPVRTSYKKRREREKEKKVSVALFLLRTFHLDTTGRWASDHVSRRRRSQGGIPALYSKITLVAS